MTSSAVQPLKVYLDSSDYSTLSNLRCQTPELESIRSELLHWRDSGEVEFWFSSTAIVEMAPLDVAATPLAEARADLLVALCGRNALVSPDMLVREELHSALQERGTPVVAHS